MRYGLFCGIIWAQLFSIEGEVRTPAGEPLSHVIVRLPQTGFQTVSNAEGRFIISVAADTLIIELRHLGYRVRRDTLYRMQGKGTYTFTLYPQEVRLGGVVITEGGKDPGEIIIRRAIAAKAYNRTCLSQYRVETYTLFSARWLEPPAPALQRLAQRSFAQGDILFMSETFSYIYFAAPDKYREEIVRSRIVGTRQYSFLGGWIFQGFDPYAERLSLAELTETPFVLPLAQDAPLYYRYRLLGSYWDEERFFYKVAVEPRSSASPCVAGYVIIADESYALTGLEWYVKPPRPLRYADSMGVRATYIPVGECYQMGELSFKGHFRISLPIGGSIAIGGEGYASYKRYQVLALSQPSKVSPAGKKQMRLARQSSGTQEKARISANLSASGETTSTPTENAMPIETLRVSRVDFGEFVRILPEASQASSAFWDSVRLAPLDSVQLSYLERHEAMLAERETTSTQGRRHRWGLTQEGIGWIYRGRSAAGGITLQWIGYTPLEGWIFPAKVGYQLRSERWVRELTLYGRYGLGWNRFLPAAQVQVRQVKYPLQHWHIAGGLQVREPTDFTQIFPFWNAIYRVLRSETPWQGYLRPFVEVASRRHFHRTIEGEVRVSWDKRAYEDGGVYEAWRAAVWMDWQPGTRLFTTPKSTRFIRPEKVMVWRVRSGGEVALLPRQVLVSLSGAISPELSISPFGRLLFQIGGAWQNDFAPWGDRLYVPTTPLVFHRSYSDFVFWGAYESVGRWGGYTLLSWLPAGALMRLLPILRQTAWQEAFTLRALYGEKGGWHLEGSFFLHQLDLRLRKTGLAHPFSIGLHTAFGRGIKRGALTIAIGDISGLLSFFKPARR
ncbi:MAG: DUF5686 family protein [Bacteroidia bacterium]|nr:DUF5686 family protein [Bacteroidia bacterium]